MTVSLKSVAEVLVPVYETAIIECKNLNIREATQYIYMHNLQHGICNAYAKRGYGIVLYNESRIRERNMWREFLPKGTQYAYNRPCTADTVEEIIDRLQYRLNFLRKWQSL